LGNLELAVGDPLWPNVLRSLIDAARLQALEVRLGHAFRDTALLERALTHASASASASNERLEFLWRSAFSVLRSRRGYFGISRTMRKVRLRSNTMRWSGATLAQRRPTRRVFPSSSCWLPRKAASGGRRKTAILAGACERSLPRCISMGV